jgi:hypothetical protein
VFETGEALATSHISTRDMSQQVRMTAYKEALQHAYPKSLLMHVVRHSAAHGVLFGSYTELKNAVHIRIEDGDEDDEEERSENLQETEKITKRNHPVLDAVGVFMAGCVAGTLQDIISQLHLVDQATSTAAQARDSFVNNMRSLVSRIRLVPLIESVKVGPTSGLTFLAYEYARFLAG